MSIPSFFFVYLIWQLDLLFTTIISAINLFAPFNKINYRINYTLHHATLQNTHNALNHRLLLFISMQSYNVKAIHVFLFVTSMYISNFLKYFRYRNKSRCFVYYNTKFYAFNLEQKSSSLNPGAIRTNHTYTYIYMYVFYCVCIYIVINCTNVCKFRPNISSYQKGAPIC